MSLSILLSSEKLLIYIIFASIYFILIALVLAMILKMLSSVIMILFAWFFKVMVIFVMNF